MMTFTLENLKVKLVRAIVEDIDESRLVEIYELYFDDDPLRVEKKINELIPQFEEPAADNRHEAI
jgi:hypothetical protein